MPKARQQGPTKQGAPKLSQAQKRKLRERMAELGIIISPSSEDGHNGFIGQPSNMHGVYGEGKTRAACLRSTLTAARAAITAQIEGGF